MDNIFYFLKIEKRETISSQFMVSLMNTDDEYFRLFLKHINHPDYISSEHIVKAEKTLYSKSGESKTFGRADIWIREKEPRGENVRYIIIESKIKAYDQYKQLDRYRKYLEESGREGMLFYLNPYAKPAGPSSSPLMSNDAEKSYQILSFQQHIIPWLNACHTKALADNQYSLAVFIKQFGEVVEKLSQIQIMLHEDKDIKSINSQDEKNSFLAALELHFWMTLSAQVPQTITNRRRFTHERISRRCAGRKPDKAYGIIAGDVRIFTKRDGRLKISKGYFNDQQSWHSLDEVSAGQNLSNLKNRMEAETMAAEIANQYLQFLDEKLQADQL